MNPKELERLKKRGQSVRRRQRKKKLKENESQKPNITLPDPSCATSLKAWFNVYGFLSIHELARLAGKSTSTIKKWQQKAGITNGDPPIVTPERTAREVEIIPEDVWACRSWFEEHYTRKRLGTSAIAKMIDRDVRSVRRRLEYYDIPIRSHDQSVRSSNPCCTEKWLAEHYYNQGLSLRECAKLAGVVPSTITNWLCKFDMDPRDIAEANHVRSKKCQH